MSLTLPQTAAAFQQTEDQQRSGQGYDVAPAYDLSNYTVSSGSFPAANIFLDEDLQSPLTREVTFSAARWDTTIAVDPASALDANGLPTGYIRGPRFGQGTSTAAYPRPRPGLTGGRTFLGAFGFRF